MSNDYINLKINGRLFPLWIMSNFKKYQIPPIEHIEGHDPCKEEKTKLELRKYQKFIGSYLDFRGPYKEMLIYHGLGSGKTASAINVYNILYNYTPGWNVFILIKASLEKNPWLSDINTWLEKDDKDIRFGNIKFIHYDSPFADKDFIDTVRKSDSSKNSLYIIDEVHNFINNVYNNMTSKMGRRAQTIYDYIVQEKKENDMTRILLLSGTPAINNPYEIALIFNLLRPGIFPKTETRFNELYITQGTYKTLDPAKKNMFQRRIMGLVSYNIGASPDLFATKRPYFRRLPMTKFQQRIYEGYEFKEEQMERKRLHNKLATGTYKSYTRQSCNFVFPYVSQDINGDRRPRPNNFRLTDKEANMFQEGRDDTLKEKKVDTTLYEKAIEMFLTGVDNYWDKMNQKDITNGRTILDDIEDYKNKYNMKFADFWIKQKNKSELVKNFYDCSPKMTVICFTMVRSEGPVIFYSNYVRIEGIDIFKLYLKYFGYTNYNDAEGRDNFRYIEYHGGIKDKSQREIIRKVFNDINNKDGKIVKVILISPIGTEGITLRNVRQVHILEPYWNEVRIQQLIGRAVRMRVHCDLPPEKRFVDIYRYVVVRTNGKWTTDEEISEIAKSKDNLISSFLDLLKEVAVDCMLFKNQNMLAEKYKCFNFNEPSLFDKQIGPAYREDLYYDEKINNGLNSMNSMVKKIKVIEIQAVHKDQTIESDKIIYSKPKQYWYSTETGVVYDHDMDYPIGKITIDINGIPNKLDKDTYIIDYMISIPHIDAL